MIKVDILILTTAYPICNDGWVKKKNSKWKMNQETHLMHLKMNVYVITDTLQGFTLLYCSSTYSHFCSRLEFPLAISFMCSALCLNWLSC